MRSTSARYGCPAVAERVETAPRPVARQPVADEFASLRPDDQAGLLQLLQMLGGVGDRGTRQPRQLVDGCAPLREQLEQSRRTG